METQAPGRGLIKCRNLTVFLGRVCFPELLPSPGSRGAFARRLHWPRRAPARGSLSSRLEFEAAQSLHMRTARVACLAVPRRRCPVPAQSLLSAPHRKEAGLPGPAARLSKPVKSTNHPTAEHAYSWPFASFDLRIRPLHECPYCHVMCTQCVNY